MQNQYKHTVKGTVHPEMFCELRLASQQNSVAALSYTTEVAGDSS